MKIDFVSFKQKLNFQKIPQSKKVIIVGININLTFSYKAVDQHFSALSM